MLVTAALLSLSTPPQDYHLRIVYRLKLITPLVRVDRAYASRPCPRAAPSLQLRTDHPSSSSLTYARYTSLF